MSDPQKTAQLIGVRNRLHIARSPVLEKLRAYLPVDSVEIIGMEDFPPHDESGAGSGTLDIFLFPQDFFDSHRKNIKTYRREMPSSSLMFFVGNSLGETEAGEIIDTFIPEQASAEYILRSVKNGFLTLQQRFKTEYLNRQLNARNQQIQELSNIGKQLMMEKDLQKLLSLILLKSREIITADAGSLYLVEEDEQKNKHLRFMITQNDSVSFDFEEFIMAISPKSIAGYVAYTGTMLNIDDVYNLPRGTEYSFNRSFDETIRYRTKSMLVIPLRNHVDEIIGVIQLINCKGDTSKKFSSVSEIENTVVPFTEEHIELVSALAGQAAVSIENNLLYRSIERLFEGFVNASVTAIESRDPTTSGHSARVALLTENLAKTVDGVRSGSLKHVRFSSEQIKEIRYASLLHDFGKVGVREQVLLKAKKLYPFQLSDILHRIGHLKKTEEIKNLQRRIQFLLDYGSNNYRLVLPEMEYNLEVKLRELNAIRDLITGINEPTITEKDKTDALQDIAHLTYIDVNGEEQFLMKPFEVKALSIKRGSLDETERLEIESHVTHTYEFLSKVPWTKDIHNIPAIAHAHHEKLNGDGYPNKLTSDQIPVQAKMMSISDIFDALTAADRPYKKSVGYERALTILQYEVNDGHIDDDLLNVFIEAEIYRKVLQNK